MPGNSDTKNVELNNKIVKVLTARMLTRVAKK